MMRSFEVRCDWPGCHGNCVVRNYASVLNDQRWKAHSVYYGPHLCPEHRHKTWEELQQELRKISDEPTGNLPA